MNPFGEETKFTVFKVTGHNIKVGVSPDFYTLKFAAGEKWYGYTYLFGPKTIYGKARDASFLPNDGAIRSSGLTITLSSVKNGNLPLAPINANEF